MPVASLGGYQTGSQTFGDGKISAFALHCSLAHSGAWEGLAGYLPQLSLTAMDLPGHGRSADWDRDHDFMDQACAMALGLLSEPAHLIGHSFGAVVALQIAADRPDLVRSLTLIEPVFFAAAGHTAPEISVAHEAEFAPFMAAIKADDPASAAEIFISIWGTGQAWANMPAPQRDYITARIGLIPAGTPAIYEDAGGLWDRLTQITQPVLLIEGAQSPAIIAAIQVALAKRLPDARRHVIEGAGHMVPITHPKPVAQAIGEFLAEQVQ